MAVIPINKRVYGIISGAVPCEGWPPVCLAACVRCPRAPLPFSFIGVNKIRIKRQLLWFPFGSRFRFWALGLQFVWFVWLVWCCMVLSHMNVLSLATGVSLFEGCCRALLFPAAGQTPYIKKVQPACRETLVHVGHPTTPLIKKVTCV